VKCHALPTSEMKICVIKMNEILENFSFMPTCKIKLGFWLNAHDNSYCSLNVLTFVKKMIMTN
jgi:hypothetical protein